MIALLAGPLAKYALYAAAALALLVAGGVYLHSVRESGVAQERAAEVARGVAHERVVIDTARAVDDAVARDADPAATLLKEWSRP